MQRETEGLGDKQQSRRWWEGKKEAELEQELRAWGKLRERLIYARVQNEGELRLSRDGELSKGGDQGDFWG